MLLQIVNYFFYLVFKRSEMFAAQSSAELLNSDYTIYTVNI